MKTDVCLLVPTFICVFVLSKQRLYRTRITILHWIQTTPVVLCKQNNVISIRNTSLYGSQPSTVVFACKRATFGPELQVSMGPKAHLWFFAFKTATLASELQVCMGPNPHLWFCAFTTATLWPELIVSMGPISHLSIFACKTAWLASEILVSMAPSPHQWFLHAKQRLLDQNYKSLWVPDFTGWFVNAKRRA